METHEQLLAIQKELADLKKLIQSLPLENPLSKDWISRTQLQLFLDYRDTQMTKFLKSENLIVSTIGKRKFITRKSIDKFLEKNIPSAGTR